MPAPRAAAQQKTLDTFIDGWRHLSVDTMYSTYAPDLKFVGLPVAVTGGKTQTREEWKAFITPMWGELSNFRADVHSVVNDGNAGKAAVHANTYGDMPKLEYRNEHIMIFHFNEDGTKITKLEDLMDSVFFQVLQKYAKEHIFNRK